MTDLLAGLAPVDAFPTVDEMAAWTSRLAERFPDRVTVRDIGRSRNGDAIQLLSIVSPGSRGRALIIGQPHPNEPIGMATIIAMGERLLENPTALEATDADWHFVPVADPDGTRLNEGWFAGPWTREHYARNFYRPAGNLQVEWTFPFSCDGFEVNAPMPETIALMAAIDETHPTVMASLHNGELGGGYFYATEGAPYDYYEQLGELCRRHSIPLHLGDPETPFSAKLGPAVFSIPFAQQIHDFVVAAGGDPADVVTGANSGEYAMRHNEVFGIAVELPYWRDDRSDDISTHPSGTSLRQVVLHGLDLQDDMCAQLRALYDQAAPLAPSPFQEAVEAFLSTLDGGYIEVQRYEAANNPEGDRPATVAELFSVMDNVHMFRLRLGGMLLRALAPDSPARVDAERTFAEWCAEESADSKAEPIPINDLVAVQAGAILTTVAHSVARART
jgi:hypothetical protein